MKEKPAALGAFREIPYMGVIYVVAEARKLGFWNGHPDWSNLGQGQPEVGPMEGAPPRVDRSVLEPPDQAYGPLEGTQELREAVAAHYNRLYRRGRSSRYTADNVSVAGGGRVALARAFCALDAVNLGYQVPDYTAYEDLIDYHAHRFSPVLLPTTPGEAFRVSAARLDREVASQGLGAFVVSNPCNPTGSVVGGEELAGWVQVARERSCTLILDEFYSHFIYEPGGGPGAGPVSAAAHVEDVDRDPVLLIDGLTKSFRYPGWRLGWAVGPPEMVEALSRAGSAVDGGPSCMVQRAALEVLEPGRADQETNALRRVFARKRDIMVQRLREMGITCAREPEGTFYVWASLEALPEPLDDSVSFFRKALERRVLTVPGPFFDVNPGRRRPGPSPYRRWMRFSFGPPEGNMLQGLDRLAELVRDHA